MPRISQAINSVFTPAVRPRLPGDAAPPAVSFVLTAADTDIDEGSGLNFTLDTTNVRNLRRVYYEVVAGINDIVVSSGSVSVISDQAQFTVTPTADLLTEGAESFVVNVYKGSRFGTLIATSGTITINDTSSATLTLTPQTLIVDEGDSVIIDVTVDSQDIPNGFVLYWTSNSADDTVIDSGSFIINDDAGSFAVTVSNDFATEGSETFTVSVRSGSVTGVVISTSPEITINDTSVTLYTITPAAASVNENAGLVFNVTTTGVPNGTTLYWTVSNGGDFTAASGSFVITDNAGSFTVTPTRDFTQEGAETFTASVRTGSISGTVVATSGTVTINDTSTAPEYTITPASSTVNEGSSLTFNVSTLGVSNNTTLYYTLSSPDDFNTASGSFVVNNNAGSFSVSPSADFLSEVGETFTASVRVGSTSGTVVATSSNVTIIDIPSVEYLVIAGGGGGGSGGDFGGPGGGGAGGYRTGFIGPIELSTNYTVSIGGGGGISARGGDSYISGPSITESPSGAGTNTIKSYGGGYGGRDASGQQAGASGGSGGGGGGGGWGGSYAGGTGNTPPTDPSQGNNGGASNFFGASSNGAGGGGGGAGDVGANASGNNGGNGGPGTESDITGTAVTRAGGGGGRPRGGSAGTGGTGGAGGGGNAGSVGAGNTGGGGGGGSTGGSGVIIFKYADTYTISNPGGGLSFTTATNVPGFKITTITAGTGNIQFS